MSDHVAGIEFRWRYDYLGGEAFHFLRWSKALPLDYFKEAMKKEDQNGDATPILVKVLQSTSSEVKNFKTAQAVLEYLTDLECKNIKDLRLKAELARKILDEKEATLAKLQISEKAKGEMMLAALSASITEQSEKTSLLLDWMYADAFIGDISQYDPLHWRSWVGGAISLQAAIQEFEALAQQYAARGEAQRSVLVKIPPGFESPQLSFESFDSAIEYIKEEMAQLGAAGTKFAEAQAEYERARQSVADAQEQVHKAREEVEAAAVAAGVESHST